MFRDFLLRAILLVVTWLSVIMLESSAVL
jgi:hypothetical protein